LSSLRPHPSLREILRPAKNRTAVLTSCGRAGRMTILVGSSLHRVVEFFYPVFGFEDFAGLGAVGGAHDAVLLHEVDQARGAAIADAQAAPKRRRRGAAHFAADAHGVLVEIVVHFFSTIAA